MKEKLILTVPYWNIQDQPERLQNLGYCLESLSHYATFHNKWSTKFELIITPVNLGEELLSEYPDHIHIPHTLEYKFEKPTRLNSLFIKLHNEGNQYVGMCDPDLILFENDYEDFFESIECKLSYNTMLTYSFVRTKPELREDLPNIQSNHELILEAKQHSEDWKVCGGIFFMSLSRFIDLGGFNEDFRVYGFDDVDYTQRFLLHYGEVISTTSVHFYHLWHPTVIKNATVEELERYEYELKYWRIHREIFKEEINKPIHERRMLNHCTPRLRFDKPYVDLSNNEIPFTYKNGKHPITSFPKAFQRQMGLIDDDVFYSIED